MLADVRESREATQRPRAEQISTMAVDLVTNQQNSKHADRRSARQRQPDSP
jgi:hypothetical protein